jgi:hypothetical protein
MQATGQKVGATRPKGSASPTLLLRISDGSCHMHRSFSDFNQALKSAEAFAGAGFSVSMMSATGRFLLGFEANRDGRPAV